VVACKTENGLGEDRAWGWQESADSLSATRFSTILRRKGNRFVRQQCRHCVEPACVSACIVGALTKTPEGAVVYDAGKCMGCRYCMLACPYGIPRYTWESAMPVIRKCTLCYPRLKEGKVPACAEACPEKAIAFGSRRAMLAEGHRRIARNPKAYVNRVFGEQEIGGTSVLYVSDISLGFLGWKPGLGDRPLPELTWAALKKVPPVVLLVGGAMSGIWWVIGRRMRMQAQAELEEKKGKDDAR
jgi:formate dehydrogenase iron-sulfur subunit